MFILLLYVYSQLTKYFHSDEERCVPRTVTRTARWFSMFMLFFFFSFVFVVSACVYVYTYLSVVGWHMRAYARFWYDRNCCLHLDKFTLFNTRDVICCLRSTGTKDVSKCEQLRSLLYVHSTNISNNYWPSGSVRCNAFVCMWFSAAAPFFVVADVRPVRTMFWDNRWWRWWWNIWIITYRVRYLRLLLFLWLLLYYRSVGHISNMCDDAWYGVRCEQWYFRFAMTIINN